MSLSIYTHCYNIMYILYGDEMFVCGRRRSEGVHRRRSSIVAQ